MDSKWSFTEIIDSRWPSTETIDSRWPYIEIVDPDGFLQGCRDYRTQI